MNVGVTGAAGFVGTHIVAALEARGHVVTQLTRTAVPPHRRLDLDLRPLPDGLFDGLDTIVHAAAYLPTSYADAREAQRCMDINALGTLAVLHGAVRAGVRHVVHLSTNLYRFSLTAVNEDAPFEPSTQASYYLVSKAAADFFAAHQREKLSVSVLRLGSVYGPGLMRGVIPTFTTALLANTPISVEDGKYQADFVHVSDVASAVVEAIERTSARTFNIGSGVALRPLEIATVLVRELGCDPALVRLTAPADPQPRGFCALDITRARTELAFTPRVMGDGLRSYIESRRS